MAFPKGHKLSGSRKGRPNKFTASIKEAFLIAFDNMGGAQGLTEWGKKNQTEFYRLCSKLIPVEVTGKDGAELFKEIQVTIVRSKAGTPGN